MLLSHSKSPIDGPNREAMALAAVALLLILATAATPLDSSVQSLLSPAASMLHSPILPVWTFIISTGSLTLGLLALMAAQTWRKGRGRRDSWRASGFFLILLALIGPALADSLGLTPCAAGYYVAAGWWLCKERNPGWATVALLTGLILGLSLGIREVATGGLRFSDLAWAALAVLGLAHALYYYVLRLPLNQLQAVKGLPSDRLPGLPAMCLLLVVAAAARLPHSGHSPPHQRLAGIGAQVQVPMQAEHQQPP